MMEEGAAPLPRCWCSGQVGPRTPGDSEGLGCLSDIYHVYSEPEPGLGEKEKCGASITHRDEEHRQSECALSSTHAPFIHDDGRGCQWSDGEHWQIPDIEG